MNTFTFVSLSYNHQYFIIEHLESIKQLIVQYGNKIEVDYILADDCSTDKTLEIASNWLDNNRELFRHVLVLDKTQNVGVVRNMLDAVKHVKTKEFKFLAGDDKFRDKNIFSLYENMNNQLIITPVNPFGDIDEKIVKNTRTTFCLIYSLNTASKIRKMIKCENFLPAPGVFIPGDFFRDNKFQSFLLQFRNIDDYPMFYYFLNVKKCGVRVLDMYYVDYRVGSGISTSKDNKKRKVFCDELKELHKIIDIKLYKYPKYLNPYKYYFKIARAIAGIRYRGKYNL